MIISGCAASRPDPNPLQGWNYCFSRNPFRSNKTVLDDYHDYIQKLPPEERKFVGIINFFEDGTGQHAVQIEIPLNGTWWEHDLIYDKENKRVKVIKHRNGRYQS
ncbi:hypothetical protein [Pedosphaera parvula]|uniref:hypothetical protein n=1 Tax=Pedosphaera parvula TaxID=1032527 RepID=UPI001ED8CF8C|nr:hypothetical protein [Pedosphaera parvula]